MTLRALARRPDRRPSIAALACIFGFAVAACSLAQIPLPWQQLDRIRETTSPALAYDQIDAFVAANTRPGERVLILTPLGHRIARDAGVTNVSLYTGSLSMPLVRQLDEAVAALRDEGGRAVFLSTTDFMPDMLQGLAARGFAPVRDDPPNQLQMWIDTTTR